VDVNAGPDRYWGISLSPWARAFNPLIAGARLTCST
jgi:hypothetical protein